jgi:hypothetical protein
MKPEPDKLGALIDTARALETAAVRYALIGGLAGLKKTGEFEHSVNLRHASGEPVQLAFDVAFDAMIERAESIDIDGVNIVVVRKDDLIAMKKRAAAGPARRKSKRLRDQADIELLSGDVPDLDEGW